MAGPAVKRQAVDYVEEKSPAVTHNSWSVRTKCANIRTGDWSS
jgi:hypothetical protein